MISVIKHFVWGIVCFIGLGQVTYAQISKVHYIPPIAGVAGENFAPFKYVITTLSEEAFTVNVVNGDSTYQENVTVSKASPVEVSPMVGTNTLGVTFAPGSRTDPDQANLIGVFNEIHPEEGLIFRGDKPFFVNLVVKMSPQGEILTSKGLAGLGTEFYSGHMNMSNYVHPSNLPASWDARSLKGHFISVMAVEDGTEVSFSNPRIRWWGQPDSLFTIKLNAGESYSVGSNIMTMNKTCGTSLTCTIGHMGTKISSTKEIAVNSGSIHGGSTNATNPSRDVGFDQIVPVDVTGTQFVVAKGNGGNKSSNNELAFFITTEDSTTVTVNGGTQEWLIPNAGEYRWSGSYVSGAMFVESDKNIYVYQTLSGSNNPQTPGFIAVPPLTLDATNEVLISGVQAAGAPFLNLIAQTGKALQINGVTVPAISAIDVPSNSDWKLYRVGNFNAYGGASVDLNVSSEGVLNVGVTISDEAIGGGGYYSGFVKDNSGAGIGKIGVNSFTLRCEGEVEMFAQGAIQYDWSAVDPDHLELLSQKNDSTFVFTADSTLEFGKYEFKVIYTVETFIGDRQDTTVLTVDYVDFDDLFGEDIRICVDSTAYLNPGVPSDLDRHYLWDENEFLSQTLIASPTFYGDSSIIDTRTTLKVSYDDGTCLLSGEVNVQTADCNRPIMEKAEMYDQDGNGIAETLKLTFDVPFDDFDSVQSIDWPAEGVNQLRGSKSIASYGEDSSGGVDSTIVYFDFTGEFEFGTEVDSLNLPYLDYVVDSIEIQDRVGAVVLSAIKNYPKESEYAVFTKDGEYQYFETTIELLVTVSEEIEFDSLDLKDFFLYTDEDGDRVSFDLVYTPKPGADSNTWIFTVDLSQDGSLRSIDSLSLNPYSGLADNFGNSTSEFYAELNLGSLPYNDGVQKQFRSNVVGGGTASTIGFKTESIKVFDEDGKFIEMIERETEISSKWVAPYNFINGKFDPQAECSDEGTLVEFPIECLASLAIGTFADEGPYTAQVYVYDQMGQFLHTWIQKFGFCGEFDNINRADESAGSNYFVQDLIWDMKDGSGRKAGSGVYLWKVKIDFESGHNETMIKSMGLMRNPDNCRLGK